MTSKNNSTLLNIIENFAGKKILVIGEAMLDGYLEGSAQRLCREAPVPVVAIQERTHVPGGAANTAVNLHSLGAQVKLLSVIGEDHEGQVLEQALEERGVRTSDVVTTPLRVTLSKQRVLATSQILLRFDQGSTAPLDHETEEVLLSRLCRLFIECDALIISDYDYGVITPRLIEKLVDLQRRRPRLIVLDSRRPRMYRDLHVTAVKPNYEETVRLLGLPNVQGDTERIRQIETHGGQVLNLVNAGIAAITLDQAGALIFHRESDHPYRTYATPEPNSHASGAGDTFVSTLALSLAAGAGLEHAAELASAAASIVVCRAGTSSCSAEELEIHFAAPGKVVADLFELTLQVAAYHRMGRRVVFTNGCFDILHRGHITYLNRAKALGDVLIVGVNSDASIRNLKGPERPINPLEDRAQVLAALSCVDHIVSFDSQTPIELIRMIRPDVFAKGGDYTRATLPEAGVVEELGGHVEILPYLADHSTTDVIERIRSIHAEKESP